MSASALLSRLLRPFSPPGPQGRALQLQLDTARLYTLLRARPTRTHLSAADEHCPDAQPVADRLSLPGLPPFDRQAHLVRTRLLADLLSTLRATRAALVDARAVRARLGFEPVVADSTLPDANRGLFVRGRARAGALVAVYPGEAFMPSQARRAREASPEWAAALASDYAIARYDGVLVDGTADVPFDVEAALPDGAKLDDLRERIEHPFAHGQLVNHPAKGERANVLQFMIDVDMSAIPRSLLALMPVRSSTIPVTKVDLVENTATRQRVQGTQYFSLRGPPSRVLRTLVLVAVRDIEEEEVFMNYRFNPAVKTPDWYAPCSEEESQRRWMGTSVFS